MDDPDGRRVSLAPITLADKELFGRMFSAVKQPLSDYSFACTYIWRASLKLSWAMIDRHLCVFANGTGDLTMLVPPLPEPGADERDLRDCLGRCFELMDRYNDAKGMRSASRIEYISDEMLEQIHAATTRDGLNLGAGPMSGDYVYAMDRMIDLAGGGLKSKRHARSKFVREHPDWRTEPYTAQHKAACMRLLKTWQRHGDASHTGEVNESQVGSQVLRRCDTLATALALEQCEALGLRGMVLFADQKLVGFTLGEALSPTQASILVEKTDADYDGAPQLIFSEFCRQFWSGSPECNAGDDWGLASLRFTKQSYRPIRLLNKYVMSRQATPTVVGYEPTHTSRASAGDDSAVRGPQVIEVPAAQATDAPGVVDEVVIRVAGLADVGAIMEVERTCFADAWEQFSVRQVRALMTNPRASVRVAWSGMQVVGWAAGLVRLDRAGVCGRLYTLGVHPAMRGRGVGRALAIEVIQELGQRGAQRVFLEVRQGNTAAIRLYEKLGFAMGSFLANYYAPGVHGHRMVRRPVAHDDLAAAPLFAAVLLPQQPSQQRP